MANNISLTMSVQVSGGPKVTSAKTLQVEAYSNIKFEIPNDSTDVQVEVQPGGVGGLKLLVITSSSYGPELTYSADAGTTTVALDQPHLFIGEGAINVLGAPETLIFNNALPGDPSTARVEILVGRDASGPVPP